MASRPEIGFEGRIFFEGQLTSGAVEVAEGRIVGVRKVSDACKVVDLGDSLLLPGGIDMHVHFRDPGWPRKEDFSTGSAAAVHGGVTAVMDMPNTEPIVADRETLEAKARAIAGRSWVDHGLAVALMAGQDPAGSADMALAFKAFMAGTTNVEGAPLEEAFRRAVGLGRPVVVHAEATELMRPEPGRDLQDHLRARPSEAEAEAIRQAHRMAMGGREEPSSAAAGSGGAAPLRVHIAHMSAAASVEVLRGLRGCGFTAEASPHHLYLDASMGLGSYGKVNPPLRTVADRAALWDALREGVIDAVASDHAPHLPEEKDLRFAEAPSGIPGVETMYPLLMHAAKKGLIALPRLVDAISVRPAAVLGLDKGAIEVGRDADLVVFDTARTVEISAADLHSKCGWTPYEGMEAIFPAVTVVGGEVVMRDGALFGDPCGRLMTGAAAGGPGARPLGSSRRST